MAVKPVAAVVVIKFPPEGLITSRLGSIRKKFLISTSWHSPRFSIMVAETAGLSRLTFSPAGEKSSNKRSIPNPFHLAFA